MIAQETRNTAQTLQLDRADTRVRHDTNLAGVLHGFIDQVRSGDLGTLFISVIFNALNPVFLALTKPSRIHRKAICRLRASHGRA